LNNSFSLRGCFSPRGKVSGWGSTICPISILPLPTRRGGLLPPPRRGRARVGVRLNHPGGAVFMEIHQDAFSAVFQALLCLPGA